MGIPDLLVLELVTVDGETASTIADCGVTTLHHEVRDNTVEAIAFVAKRDATISNTKCAEILGRLWHIFTEDLKDNTTLLETILTFVSDRDVEVRLHIARLESREAAVVSGWLGSLLVVVYAFAKEGSEASLCRSCLLLLLLFDCSMMGSQGRISRVKLDSCNDISHGLSELSYLSMGY